MLRRYLSILLIITLACFTSCGREAKSGEKTAEDKAEELKEASLAFFAMDTYMNVRAFGADDALLEEAQKAVAELEKKISVTDPSGEISLLNREGKAVLSEDTAALLARALELCSLTGGALDISVYPVVRAWGFTTEEYRVPAAAEIDGLQKNVDYRRIALNGGEASLPAGMEIDLGSIGKGFAGDLISSVLKKAGVGSALMDLGGNIQALGSKPDGSPWRVAVRDPKGSGVIGVVQVTDGAVVTSGGYERYFEGEDGTVYWHIMDPVTGSPSRSGLISATAVGSEGIYCDALSTALFVMGEERALELWRERGDFEMILVTEDGRVLVSAGLKDAFTPDRSSGYEFSFIGEEKP